MKRPALWLALALVLLSASLISYRIVVLHYPPLPSASGDAWNLTLEATLKGDPGKELKVTLGLPEDGGQYLVTQERVESGLLEFELSKSGTQRFGIWSGAAAEDDEFISYKAVIVPDPRPRLAETIPALSAYPAEFDAAELALLNALSARWNRLPSNAKLNAVMTASQNSWGTPAMTPAQLQSWTLLVAKHAPASTLLALLRAAQIPAREVRGLALTQSISGDTMAWVEVWHEAAWQRIDPRTGKRFASNAALLPLTYGGTPTMQVANGKLLDASWNLGHETIRKWRVLFERVRTSPHALDRWSLFHLPDKFQETFRILLLVPIGALLICILRNVVGLPTFGIFMPVLMALAFRSTGLGYGLGIFVGVVLVGYVVRRWIDRLRLMLVPRLSLMLTLVVGLFTLIALAGNRSDQRQLMAVGLVPFVILTMTIERLFVILEEAGNWEALRTAAGSALVATITYQIIRWDTLQLAFFVYPELLLTVAAAQLLLGRYTGYRLSELIRFRVLRKRS